MPSIFLTRLTSPASSSTMPALRRCFFRLLQKLAEDVQELGFVESSPKQDGRNMTMVIGPHKKKADAKIDADAARATKEQARADRKAEEDAEREAAHAAGPVAQKKERRRSENLDPEIEA